MHLIARRCGVAVGAAAVVGVTSSSAQGTSDVPPVRLRGRTVDSTGHGIAGVRLQIVGSGRSTRSDALGQFEIDSLFSGSVTIAFAHPQFIALTLGIPLAAGDTVPVPVMMLAPDPPPHVQLSAGMLVGLVTDQTGRPISDADILVATSGQTARSDSLGRFVLHNLPPMRHLLRVRKFGFYVQYLNAAASPTTALRAVIAMESMGTTLGEVVVRADRIAPRLRAFYERARSNGWGQFATRAEILERGWTSVSDMLFHMRGVFIGADEQGRPVPMTRQSCPMQVLLDGQPLELEGVSLDALVSLNDLAGIEVYRSGKDAPSQFTFGRPGSAACGVIGFWTR